MRRVSPNPVICAFFCAIAAMGLSVCVQNPVDLKGFVEDDKVKEIAEKGQEKVILKGTTGKPGSGKITDLAKNEYYVVEEWENGSDTLSEADNIMFVAKGGTTDTLLNGIGRLNGTEITGLTNNNTYRVTPATSLPNNTISYYYEPAATTGNVQMGDDGIIKIKPPYPPSGNIVIGNVFKMDYLPINGDRYDFVRVSSGNAASIAADGELRMNASAGTSFDYVFYCKADKANIKLNFLTVIFEEEGNGEAVVTPTFAIDSDKAPILEYSTNGGLSWADVPTKADEPTKAEITVNSSMSEIQIRVKDSTVTNYSEFMWCYNDTSTSPNNANTPLTINKDNPPFNVGKTYILTAVVKYTNGKYYGKIVFVKVDI
jgi:hypothetical protein